MANINTPVGLAVQRPGSTDNAGGQQVTVYAIPVSDATNAYYMGDGVIGANGGDVNGISNVSKWVGTTAIRGVIMGIYPENNPGNISFPGASAPLSLEQNYVPIAKPYIYYVMV